MHLTILQSCSTGFIALYVLLLSSPLAFSLEKVEIQQNNWAQSKPARNAVDAFTRVFKLKILRHDQPLKTIYSFNKLFMHFIL